MDQSDIAQVAQRTEELRQVSQQLDTGISQLRGLYMQIKGQWYGPASEAFRKELDYLILQMQDTSSKLVATAASLEVAQTTDE